MALILPTAADKTTEYEDFYESTLSAPCTAADADIYPTTLPASAVGFLVLDPLGVNPEIIFYNFKGTNFVRVPSVVDGQGRGVGNTIPRPYEQGTKIGMYSIAEFFEGLATGVFMRDGFLQSRHFSASIDPNSWIGTGETWNYVGHIGLDEYQYVTAGDKTAKYQRGMKVRMPRQTTVAGTMVADFEQSSSQYASRANASITGALSTITDDITMEATIFIENINDFSAQRTIWAKTDATQTAGIKFSILPDLRLLVQGFGGGGADRLFRTYQSLPVGEPVHVAGSLDVSGGLGELYINGKLIPSEQALSSAGTGWTTVGDIAIGRPGALNSEYFDGWMSEVRVWQGIRTLAQIRDNMNVRLVGNEAGLIGLWKLDGNFNDSTANNNHLTAANGAIATLATHYMYATEFGVLTDMAFSAGNTTITVYTGNKHQAPAENLTGVGYSAAQNPIGFDADPQLWTVKSLNLWDQTVTIGSVNQWIVAPQKLYVPTGRWIVGYDGIFQASSTAVGDRDLNIALTNETMNNGRRSYPLSGIVYGGADDQFVLETLKRETQYSVTVISQSDASSTWSIYGRITAASGSEQYDIRGDIGYTTFYARCAWI